MANNIKGILVGCDDEKVGGYEWVINHNDWDNGNKGISNRLNEFKNQKDFRIYFYVFKGRTEYPAKTSDEYRGTIFGRAEIKKVELYKNDSNQYKYTHHIKLKNLEQFEPKIKLEDIEEKLEKYGWSDSQIENNPFANNLRQQGLLLTKKDCELINKLVSKNSKNIKKAENNDATNKTQRYNSMNKFWFFVANPRDINNWKDTKEPNWVRVEGRIPWGIPDKSRDLDNLRNVEKEDVILCYHAFDREIIGCCRCKRTYYHKDENDGHSNHIDISEINFRNPISLDELKKGGFKFIDDYLSFPRGRSVVPVPKDDWERFKKFWAEYQKCEKIS